MRKAAFLVFVFMFAAGAFAQNAPAGFDMSNYGVRIEPDKRVMIVLATLEAARTTNEAGEQVPVINTPLSAEGSKYRELLRSDLAALNPELRQRISTFLISYKSRNPKLTDAELVSPFISMAYALTPAPELLDPVVTSDLPGNLLDVLDFAPLVRDFYRRSSFSGNINEYVKAYQKASDGMLRNSSRDMVNELLNYLHTKPQIYYSERIKTETRKSGTKKTTLTQTETRTRERHFYIVPEMLAPLGQINFLNVKDDYFVVLPPESDLTFSEVRRGFLQFVIDPIVLNNSKDIATIKDGVKGLLDERRKVDPKLTPDVYLTISRSIVAAIDSKQNENIKNRIATEQSREKIDRMKTVEEKKVVSAELEKYKQAQADEAILRLSEDYEKGAILVFYFAEQLKGVEDSGFDIASSMREMILSFDATKETGRYGQFADSRKRAIAAREERKRNPTATIIAENPVTARLVEIQKTIEGKDYAKANTDLKQLLDKNPGEPRIYYSLGRVASLSAQSLTDPADADKQKAKLLEAKVAYENVLRIAEKQRVDAALVSRSYVALAKIYEFYDEKTYAMAVYDAAIKVGDVTDGAYKEAMAAKARLIKDQ
jgi:tetratricopeptide (TPR) repeat protein